MPGSFIQHVIANKDNPEWVAERKKGGSRIFNKIPFPECFNDRYEALYQLLMMPSSNLTADFADWFKAIIEEEFNQLINEDGSPKDELLAPLGLVGKVETHELLGTFMVEAISGPFNQYMRMKEKADRKIVVAFGGNKKYMHLQEYQGVNINIMLGSLRDQFKKIIIDGHETLEINSHLDLSAYQPLTQLSRFTDEESAYKASIGALSNLVDTDKTDLYKIGQNIRREIQSLKGQHPDLSTAMLTEVLDASTEVFKVLTARKGDPLAEMTPNIDGLAQQIEKLEALQKPSTTDKLKGLLLGLAGLVLAACCITAAVMSSGVSLPVSMMGMHLGVSMIAAGIFIGLGVVALGASGLSFFSMKKDPSTPQAQRLNPLCEKLTELKNYQKPQRK